MVDEDGMLRLRVDETGNLATKQIRHISDRREANSLCCAKGTSGQGFLLRVLWFFSRGPWFIQIGFRGVDNVIVSTEDANDFWFYLDDTFFTPYLWNFTVEKRGSDKLRGCEVLCDDERNAEMRVP